MRLHRYKAADPHRLRLVVNRYPGEWPIGVALQRRQRVWSLVWRGPASTRAITTAPEEATMAGDWTDARGAGPRVPGSPPAEALIRSARGDDEPLIEHLQAENTRLRAEIAVLWEHGIPAGCTRIGSAHRPGHEQCCREDNWASGCDQFDGGGA